MGSTTTEIGQAFLADLRETLAIECPQARTIGLLMLYLEFGSVTDLFSESEREEAIKLLEARNQEQEDGSNGQGNSVESAALAAA